MPTETIYVVSAVTVAFVVFAIVLAWADRHARGYPHKPAE